MSGREVLFEHTVVGDVARCAAVDPETGLEVVAVGPAHGSRAALEFLAMRKLERALRGPAEPAEALPSSRRGKLV